MKKLILFMFFMFSIAFQLIAQELVWDGNVIFPNEFSDKLDLRDDAGNATAQVRVEAPGLDITKLEYESTQIRDFVRKSTYIDLYICLTGNPVTVTFRYPGYKSLDVVLTTSKGKIQGQLKPNFKHKITIAGKVPPAPVSQIFDITNDSYVDYLSHTKARPGAKVSFEVHERENHKLINVVVDDKSITANGYNYSFVMPGHDVHIMTKWQAEEKAPVVENNFKNAPKNKYNYLTFTAQEPNSTVRIKNRKNNPDIEYSVNEGETWQKLTVQYSVVLRNIGDKMLVRGNNPEGFSSNMDEYSSFKMTGKISASGSVMSLIDGNGCTLSIPDGYCCFGCLFFECESLTTAPELPATNLATMCYYYMFSGCTNLTTAPKLPATTLAGRCYEKMFSGCTNLTTAPKLSATTLAYWCYNEMFEGCTNLTTAPKLPATTLADGCYERMFEGCSSLTTAPKLPATTLADCCYERMFEGCTNLTTAPKLPATTLADWCYSWMFSRCTKLTTPPELPATTLAKKCYSNMFSVCTSLTTAPELPTTTLADACYEEMFLGCNNLKSIKVRFTDWEYDSSLIDKDNCDLNPTGDWLNRVASSGTFYCPRALKKEFGRSHIPKGWEVEYID